MKNLYWFAGVVLTTAALIFTEGTLIVTARTLGVLKATALRAVFTIPLSFLVIYLATKSNHNHRFQSWLKKKEAELSSRVRAVVDGGKALAVLNTALFLGPIIASILMLMIGFEARKVYVYAFFLAIASAWAWCSFYSGLFLGVEKIIYRIW